MFTINPLVVASGPDQLLFHGGEDGDCDEKASKGCCLLTHVIGTLHKCFLYDRGSFVTKERFETLLLPLTNQVNGGTGGGATYCNLGNMTCYGGRVFTFVTCYEEGCSPVMWRGVHMGSTLYVTRSVTSWAVQSSTRIGWSHSSYHVWPSLLWQLERILFGSH